MDVNEIHNRKRKSLVVNKFLFELNKSTGKWENRQIERSLSVTPYKAEGKKYWRCVETNCPAKVKTENSEIIGGVQNGHNHRVDVIKLVDKKFNSILKAKRKANVTAPSKKIQKEAKKEFFANPCGLLRDNILVGIKPHHQKKDVIRNAKKKLMPTEPESRDELVLFGSWKETQKEKSFIIADDNNECERMLLFATEEFIKALCSANVVYMHGTIICVPNIFSQLYTLHVFVRGMMVPVVYVLLPDRTVQTYIRMFSLIQQYCERRNIVFDPELFQIDYEMAVKKAIEEVFGLDKMRGCFFHFSQCIWRKVQEYGLVNHYSNDCETNRLILRLLALPLVPLTEKNSVWLDIHAEAPNTQSAENLLDYVVRNWVDENAVLNRNVWNHYDNYGPRTTNHLEGWQSVLNKNFNCPHPRFFRFLDVLKDEQNRFEDDIESRGFGHPNPTPRKKIRDRTQRFLNLKEQASRSEITWLEFAGACGYLLPSQCL